MTGKAELDAELDKLRAEVCGQASSRIGHPRPHDYSEAETRDYFIDVLLQRSRMDIHRSQGMTASFEVSGMPNREGRATSITCCGATTASRWVWSKPSARPQTRCGQQQAKLYADCLEAKFGQRPVIFYSNGYEHWIWDDRSIRRARCRASTRRTSWSC